MEGLGFASHGEPEEVKQGSGGMMRGALLQSKVLGLVVSRKSRTRTESSAIFQADVRPS